MDVVCDKKVGFVIVGKKTDLVSDYDDYDAGAVTKSINGTYIRTTAKTGYNLPQLLDCVVRGLRTAI